MMPVRLESAALRSRVKHSTTEPLRSPILDFYRGGPMVYFKEIYTIFQDARGGPTFYRGGVQLFQRGSKCKFLKKPIEIVIFPRGRGSVPQCHY